MKLDFNLSLFNKIDIVKEKINFYKTYDPVISIVKDNFQLNITQHLASLKSKKRTDTKEDIRKCATSKGTEIENASEIQKKIYLDIGRKYACTLFMFDMVNKPFEQSDIKLFYEILFNTTEYRTDAVMIIRQDGEKHQFIDSCLIPNRIETLIKWLKDIGDENNIHPLIIISKFHYDFMAIHPFLDGNGRVGRLLMNILLMKFHYLPILIKQADSIDYYEAFQEGDNGNIEPLAKFISEKQEETQNEFVTSPEYLSIVAKHELEEQLKAIKGNEKCFVLTEDSKTDNLIKLIFEASGFDILQTSIISYNGCSQIGSVTLFSIFVKQRLPHIEIVVHRDRDYLTNEEIVKLEEQFSKIGVHLFITDGTDIESHLVNKFHINKCHSTISIEEANLMIEQSIENVKEKSLDLFKKREFGEKHKNKSTHLANAIVNIYNNNKFRFSYGKALYKSIKNKIQTKIGNNPKLEIKSEFLVIPKLEEIAKGIWK